MNKYYHFTSLNNFNSIMQYGLKPQSGFRSYSIQDKDCGVFLSKGIKNSIQMFSHILNYYLKIVGIEGTEVIKDCKNDIQRYNLGYTFMIDIDECNLTIKRIEDVRNCGSFQNYLGGAPCLLSIEGIKVEDESQPDNCCYKDIIPPSNIKIIALKNKYSNLYIYDLEAILSYYMNFFNINDYSDDAKDDVEKLYSYRNYSYNEYEIIEIPIIHFIQDYNNEKTLTLS